jgi:hypothetical protein
MTDDGPSSPDSEHRVLKFRRRLAARRPHPPSPVDDLAKFARGGETDDYRHRMLVNAAAFVFVAALIGAGLWLAGSLAELRRNQDCALSGRRNCLPIEVNKSRF